MVLDHRCGNHRWPHWVVNGPSLEPIGDSISVRRCAPGVGVLGEGWRPDRFSAGARVAGGVGVANFQVTANDRGVEIGVSDGDGRRRGCNPIGGRERGASAHTEQPYGCTAGLLRSVDAW
jgi:hypothetical protein